MVEKECGMSAAKRVAGTNDTVGLREGEGIESEIRVKSGRFAADRSGSHTGANRRAGQRELHQPTATERVPEAAFPANERCVRKRLAQCRRFQPPGFERSGAMSLQPDAPAFHRFAHRSETRFEAGTV